MFVPPTMMAELDPQKINSAVYFRGGGGSFLRGGDVGRSKGSAKSEGKMDRSHLRGQHGDLWFDLGSALGLESP